MDQVVEVSRIDRVVISTVSEDRNLTTIRNESFESAEIASLESVLQVVHRVIEFAICVIVVVVSSVIDVDETDIPIPIAAIAAYIDVIAGKVTRQEGVAVPRRDDDVIANERRCAVVRVPEVVVAPTRIVVIVARSPSVVIQAAILSREVLAERLEFHRIGANDAVVRRVSIGASVFNANRNVRVVLVVHRTASRWLTWASTLIATVASVTRIGTAIVIAAIVAI